MTRNLRSLAITLSIAAAWAGDKDPRFVVKPAAEYAAHQTQEKVTIGVAPYVNDDEVRVAFNSKKNPNQFSMMPVLVVIQNDTGKTLRVSLQAQYVDARSHHVDAVPPADVQFAGSAPKRRDSNIGMAPPIPLPRRASKGGPLSGVDFEGRAFAARMIPAGEKASGFVYFNVRPEPGASVYLTGLSDAASGNELFYFEIPIDGKQP